MRLASVLIIIAIGLIFGAEGHSQPIPIELSLSNRDFRFQNFYGRDFNNNSKLGYFQTSSLYHFFESERVTEIMNQSYITYALNGNLKLATGYFYATHPGFKPSIAVQFMVHKENLMLLAVPRMDLWQKPSYEIMGLLEYRPKLSEKCRMYSRVQFMNNFSKDTHNRSYQNFRIGIEKGKKQFGLALNIDEYGPEWTLISSYGLFVRHVFSS